MEEPRCGMSDTKALRAVGRARRYLHQGSYWKKEKLTYRIVNYSVYSRIPRSKIQAAIRKALSKWQVVSNLRFHETSSRNADILIKFARGSHNDPYPFDGRGGTLAHAYYPMNNKETVSIKQREIKEQLIKPGYDIEVIDREEGIMPRFPKHQGKASIPKLHQRNILYQGVHLFHPLPSHQGLAGDVHFDDDERFTLGTSHGTNLFWVALHEFGHSIGLEHSNVKDAVMYPWYKGYKGDDVNLREDDILGIQNLYGSPVRKTAAPPVTEQKVHARPKEKAPIPKSVACIQQIKAIFLGHDHKTYVINKDKLYILGRNLNVERGPVKIDEYYPGLTKVDAVLRREDGRVVFYYDDRFVVYEGRHRVHGPYQTIHNGFKKGMANLDAALEWTTRGIRKQYFFKKDKYWRYDPSRRRVDEGYPKKIEKNWEGIPSDINAVFRWRNKVLYFFKGSQFYRFDTRRIELVKGYPKTIAGDFVLCPKASVSALKQSDPLKPSSAVGNNLTLHNFLLVTFASIVSGLVS